jgi:uncharacterized integral membrane protein
VAEDRDDTATPRTDPPARTGPSAFTRFGHGVMRGIGIAVVALFTAFALANRQYVEFGWLFGATEIQEVSGERVSGGVPLIVLLVGAFVLGAIAGAVLVTLRTRARRREAR